MIYEKLISRFMGNIMYFDDFTLSEEPKAKHLKSFEKIASCLTNEARICVEFYYEKGRTEEEAAKYLKKDVSYVNETLKSIDKYFSLRSVRLFVQFSESDYNRFVTSIFSFKRTGNDDRILDVPMMLVSDIQTELSVNDCVKQLKEFDSDTRQKILISLLGLNLNTFDAVEYIYSECRSKAELIVNNPESNKKYENLLFEISNIAKVMGYRDIHMTALLFMLFMVPWVGEDFGKIPKDFIRNKIIREYITEGIITSRDLRRDILTKMPVSIVEGLNGVKFLTHSTPSVDYLSLYGKQLCKSTHDFIYCTDELNKIGICGPRFTNIWQYNPSIAISPKEKREKQKYNGINSIIRRG